METIQLSCIWVLTGACPDFLDCGGPSSAHAGASWRMCDATIALIYHFSFALIANISDSQFLTFMFSADGFIQSI